VFAAEVDAMVRHVLGAHPDAVRGTELDPAQLRARREKLIARAEELVPKQPAQVAAGGGAADLASQLKQAMRQNAFGQLRFSGRDPIEVIDELRASWAESGPFLDDADHAQGERFEAVIARILPEGQGRSAEARGGERGGERGGGDRDRDRDDGRRRRRDRRSAEQPVASPEGGGSSTLGGSSGADAHDAEEDAGASAPTAAASVAAAVVAASAPSDAHEAASSTAHADPAPPVVADAPPAPAAEPPRRSKPTTVIPPLEGLDTGWDLGDEDPTAGASEAAEAAEAEQPEPPSSGEMAGDGAVEGDGLDQVD
jgi:hypothetical protein